MTLKDRIIKRLQEARKSPAERRFRARVAMKRRKAARRGESTTDAAEAHRMGRMSAESEAAGNPELAKRQRETGKAAKRGTSTTTRPSTVYGKQS